jgi:hypothetical protein
VRAFFLIKVPGPRSVFPLFFLQRIVDRPTREVSAERQPLVIPAFQPSSLRSALSLNFSEKLKGSRFTKGLHIVLLWCQDKFVSDVAS